MLYISIYAAFWSLKTNFVTTNRCFLKGINCTAYLLSLALIKVTDVMTSVSCSI